MSLARSLAVGGYGFGAYAVATDGVVFYDQVSEARRPRSLQLVGIRDAKVHVNPATVLPIRTAVFARAATVEAVIEALAAQAVVKPVLTAQVSYSAKTNSGAAATAKLRKVTVNRSSVYASAGATLQFVEAYAAVLDRPARASAGSGATVVAGNKCFTKYSPAYVQAINNPSDEELAVLALKLTNYL